MVAASLVIAILSFFFAVFTYIKHDKELKEQQKKINYYQIAKIEKEETEQKKAIIRAFMSNISGQMNRSGTLVIKNYGKATAHNVQFRFLTFKRGGVSCCPLNLEQLFPQEQQEFFIMWSWEGGGKYRVRITWDDDFGTNRQEELTLNL